MSDFSRIAERLADRYRIERELGRGAMATVFLARDLRHDRDVAIKVMHDELAASLSRQRFLREIRLAAKLAHPHILPLHDSGDAEGMLFYVMPNAEGRSLRDKMNAGPIAVADAVRVTIEVADALDFAHRHGIVHRDIKPENIVLLDGHAMVADFGIGKAMTEAVEDTLTQGGTSIGTPAYMSPE
jgi:serine/threonine-protein kinase